MNSNYSHPLLIRKKAIHLWQKGIHRTEICSELSISKPTLCRWIKNWKNNRDLFLSTPPKGHCRPKPKPPQKTHIKAQIRIFSLLKDEIKRCHWPINEPIPKVRYLANQWNCSNRTVLEALRLALKEGLIRRSGKGFIVGGQTDKVITKKFHQTIWIIANRKTAWISMRRSERTFSFVWKFQELCEKFNIRLRLFVLNRHTSSFQTIEEDIHQTLGFLLIPVREEMPEIEKWVENFLRFKKPIVWFDKNNEKWAYKIHSPKVTRCHFSERKLLEVAVQFLKQNGYKSLLYLFDETIPWQKTRQDTLRLTCQQYGMTLFSKIVTPLKLWYDPRHNGIIENLQSLQNLNQMAVQKCMGEFEQARNIIFREKSKFDDIPEYHGPFSALVWFVQLFYRSQYLPRDLSAYHYHAEFILGLIHSRILWDDKKCLAWIAPNDKLAKKIMSWMERINMEAGKHYSLLSFDNHPDFSLSSMTTVDFGFLNLAEQAFRSIAQNLPTTRDAKGGISSIPILVDRGSVSPLAGISAGSR